MLSTLCQLVLVAAQWTCMIRNSQNSVKRHFNPHTHTICYRLLRTVFSLQYIFESPQYHYKMCLVVLQFWAKLKQHLIHSQNRTEYKNGSKQVLAILHFLQFSNCPISIIIDGTDEDSYRQWKSPKLHRLCLRLLVNLLPSLQWRPSLSS